MCCRHTSFSGSLSQRCRSDFGFQKLNWQQAQQVHTMFVTNHGIWQQHLTAGHLLLSVWTQSHPLCQRSTLLPTRKEASLVGGKYNKNIQHSHKMPRTICFCFKSVPSAHSTLGAPVFIYLHFFPDLNYLCKQTNKKVEELWEGVVPLNILRRLNSFLASCCKQCYWKFD